MAASEGLTARDIARALGGETSLGAGGWKCRCPAHRDDTSSLSVKDSNGKVLVRCHADCDQAAVVDALKGLDLWPSRPRSSESGGSNKASWTPIWPLPDDVPKPSGVEHRTYGTPVRHWTYRDVYGKPTGYVFRFEQKVGDQVKKTTLPYCYCESDDGRRQWTWKAFAKPRPLYNLHLLAKRPRDPVAVFEGEKAADAATALFPEYVCVSWPGGSKALKYADFTPLAGRDVTLWPDADEPGRKAMQALGEVLFVEGASRVRTVQVPEKLDEVDRGWDVADTPPDWLGSLEDLLKQAQTYKPGGQDVVDTVNRRYAFVLLGGRGAVLRETKDLRSGKTLVDYLTVEGFSQFHSNVRVPVGKADVPLGKYWMGDAGRRTYEGVTFSPGGTSPAMYNLWRGHSFEPDPKGEWGLFRDHLLQNAASGNQEWFNFIFAWFAQIMQQPDVKVGTSLCFRGSQGTGKTFLGSVMGRLIHNHYTMITTSRQLFGNFNSHLASTILLHCDESFWGGDPRHAGQLRGMVTSDNHMVELKGRDIVEMPNYIRLLITTNNDWVVPAAAEERRFAVFDMGRGREQDREYFAKMQRQLRDGGYAGLLHDLLTFDLSQVDVGVIPDTDALRSQKTSSMTEVAKFWTYCLTEAEILPGMHLGWPAEIGSDRLYHGMLEQMQMMGSRYRPTSSEFLDEIRKMCPPDSVKDVRRMNSGKKSWSVTLPDLEQARQFMDDKFRTQFPYKREQAEQAPEMEF